MDEQLFLPGTDKPEFTTDHFFVGLLLPPEIAEEIFRFAGSKRIKYGLRGELQEANRLHLTLNFFRTLERDWREVVRAVSKASATVAASARPFEVRFDRVKSFPGSGAFVLTDDNKHDSNAALKDFRRQLSAGYDRNEIKYERQFTPHVTMLRDRRKIMAEEAVESLSWKVEEIVLVRSHVGKTHYEFLERWKLGG